MDVTSVGVDIGGTKLLLVAVGGGERAAHRVPTGPDTGPAEIEREIRAFLDRLGAPAAALGVAVPGLVDESGAVVACDVLPRLEGWSAPAALAAPGRRVAVLNDAEAALLEEAAELPAGATAGIVMAGTGIGAAFRVHGVPLRGARGWAGELGYLPLVAGGEARRLDDLAGGAALAARVGGDGAALRARADAGDAAALAAVREAGEALGLGLAAVVNLLNPELLVLGGGLLSLPGYEAAALESARRHSLPGHWAACSLRRVRTGEEVVALGAARAASRGS